MDRFSYSESRGGLMSSGPDLALAGDSVSCS